MSEKEMSDDEYFRLDMIRKHFESETDNLDEDIATIKAQITELENKLTPKMDELTIMLHTQKMYERELKRIEDLLRKELDKK